MFGEKDYQQLKVVTRMARDLDLPLRVIGVPTVREKDGLAMSSRNAYLSPRGPQDRAARCHRALKDTAAAIKAGTPTRDAVAQGRAAIEQAGFALDYLEARHAETLAPIQSVKDGPIRLLVAAQNRNDPADRQYPRLRRRPNCDASDQTEIAQFAAQRFRHGADARRRVVRGRAAHP